MLNNYYATNTIDSICHKKLLETHGNIRIRGHSFLQSYSIGRSQIVDVNGVHSTFQNLACEIPHRTDLGFFHLLNQQSFNIHQNGKRSQFC